MHPTRSFEGQKIVIVGAGLVGTLGAIMLAQRGARVELVERQTFDPVKDYSNQRSFNVTISSRGEAALKAAGVWERMTTRVIPITARMCHMGVTQTSFPYSRDHSVALFGARRADVNAELIAAAASTGNISFRFGWTLMNLDKDSGAITIAPVDGHRTPVTISDAAFVIGADGINSAVRRLIQRGERVDFTQRFLDWNYRELLIPASPDPNRPARMDPHSLHIWPRGDLMMFALPNPDGSFTGNFIYPVDGDEDFERAGLIGELFSREFPDVAELIPDVEERLRSIPPSYFQTQRSTKWFHGDKFVLVGDAAAATVPFYGQGMNSGFESMVELVSCLEQAQPGERKKAFQTYQRNRKPHTDAVADLSISNFDELRSNFKHILPQARRQVDVMLYGLFPRSYVPLHVQISHSLAGYRTAIDQCAARDRRLRYFGFDLLVYAFGAARLASNLVIDARAWLGGLAAKRRRAAERLGTSAPDSPRDAIDMVPALRREIQGVATAPMSLGAAMGEDGMSVTGGLPGRPQ